MENLSALHWLVMTVGTLASTLGGFLLARTLPRFSPLGLLGEVLGVLAVVYLFMQGVPAIPAILPVLIGSVGSVVGVMTNSTARARGR